MTRQEADLLIGMLNTHLCERGWQGGAAKTFKFICYIEKTINSMVPTEECACSEWGVGHLDGCPIGEKEKEAA